MVPARALPHANQPGFSLLELLACLALLGIIATQALPPLSAWLDQQRQHLMVRQLMAGIQLARSLAIHSGQLASVCGGQAHCNDQAEWHGGLLVVSGPTDAPRVHWRQPIASGHYWQWSGLRDLPHLSFTAEGTTHALNGTLTLCRQGVAVQQIVLNMTGRARPQRPATGTTCR